MSRDMKETQSIWSNVTLAPMCPSPCVQSESVAVAHNRYTTIAVGSKHSGVSLREALQHVAIRMAEGVLEARRNDCERRCGRIEEWLNRGRSRSVMADFENG